MLPPRLRLRAALVGVDRTMMVDTIGADAMVDRVDEWPARPQAVPAAP